MSPSGNRKEKGFRKRHFPEAKACGLRPTRKAKRERFPRRSQQRLVRGVLPPSKQGVLLEESKQVFDSVVGNTDI